MNFKNLYTSLIIVGIGFLLYACANKGQGPTGGLKDVTPPKIMKSTPENGTLNFKKKEIEIIFDENISIDNATENVLISPPQQKQPEVRGNAKVVTVQFEEDLLDSTTYTINFGDAIVDLNEKNPLKNYRFAFSTSDEIDTLRIAGTLINAEDLNPMPKILVGIYSSNTNDSVFFQKPFLRIAKTDENGRFVIDNVKAGTYKIFAVDEVIKNYYYDPSEGVAFIDSMVTPITRIEEMYDTVWKDSLTIDTIRPYMGTRFLPDNILLRFFKDSKKRQYFVKSERKRSESFTLYFNTTLPELPVIEPLNFFEWDGKYLLQKNNTLDTLTFWITDSMVYNLDTLELKMSYQKTDSLFNLVPQTDTISVIMRKALVNSKAKKAKATSTKTEFYTFKTNINNSFDVYMPIVIDFDAPLVNVDLSMVHLSEKVDTILKPLEVKWSQADSTKMKYAIAYKWEPEKLYVLTIDSTAFTSIYNLQSNKYSMQFKIKSLEEYSAVKIFAAEFDSTLVFQMLTPKDVVLNTKPALSQGTLFEYLRPGDYYVRAFIDSNRNGVWDPGNIEELRQPEEVFYFNKKLTLRANWEYEEIWDIYDTPLLKQKAAELMKMNAITTSKKR